jgi:hypothetical protein
MAEGLERQFPVACARRISGALKIRERCGSEGSAPRSLAGGECRIADLWSGQLGELHSNSCDLNHNVAVWQGYGLFGSNPQANGSLESIGWFHRPLMRAPTVFSQ